MRKFIRRFLLGYLLAGILLTSGTTLMTSCAVSPNRITLPVAAAETTVPASLAEAKAAKDSALLRENINLWDREQAARRKDAFTEALAAYHIGSLSGDYRWSLLSVKLFNEILDENPNFNLARAWRGSAHAVYAGDYPIKGFLLVIPGPGFIRLWHVRRAFIDLNNAVENAPDDPVVRLIRAATFIGMPARLGGHDTGAEDMDVLAGWTSNPASNPQNQELLESQGWLRQYYLGRAKAMVKLDQSTEARLAWQDLLQVSDDPADKELAQWHLK